MHDFISNKLSRSIKHKVDFIFLVWKYKVENFIRRLNMNTHDYLVFKTILQDLRLDQLELSACYLLELKRNKNTELAE